MHKFKIACKKLKNKRKHGEGYIDTVVKIIACVLVGALVISGLAFLANNAMNTANIKVSELFKDYTYSGNYNLSGGGGSGGLGGGGAVLPGENPTEESAGLYGIDGSFKSWNDLVADGEITLNGAKVTAQSLPKKGKLVISKSVTNIGIGVFLCCDMLTGVTIPSTINDIEESVFERCYSLTDVVISNGVTNISGSAFYGCTSLKNVTIPDSVTNIGYDAFANCSSLETISIGKSVENIDLSFRNSLSLTKIIVDEDNNNYCDVNGILFNKDKTELVYYPAGISDISYIVPNTVTDISECAFEKCTSLTSITIPNSITSIGDGAFGGCTSLSNITIPDGIINIGDSVFEDCTSLTSVTIPKTVEKIGYAAFNQCVLLQDVYFNGTEAEWFAIDINDQENANGFLILSTIHYNS